MCGRLQALLARLILSGMDWHDLDALIKDERKAGNPVAQLIHSLQVCCPILMRVLLHFFACPKCLAVYLRACEGGLMCTAPLLLTHLDVSIDTIPLTDC